MTRIKHKLSELLPVYKNREGVMCALKIINIALHEEANKYEGDDQSRTAWTKEIARIMSAIMPPQTGNGYPLRTYSHSHDSNSGKKENHEYLIDHVWSYEVKKGDDADFFGLALAMEVEWGGTLNDAWTDFYKLADIKADLKIFLAELQVNIYNGKKEILVKSMVKFLDGHIHFADEEKILVIFWSKSAKLEDWTTSYIVGKHFLENI